MSSENPEKLCLWRSSFQCWWVRWAQSGAHISLPDTSWWQLYPTNERWIRTTHCALTDRAHSTRWGLPVLLKPSQPWLCSTTHQDAAAYRGGASSTYSFHHCQGGDKCNLPGKTEIWVMGRKRPDWWPSVPSPRPSFGSTCYLLSAGSAVCRAHPAALACSSTWWLWPVPRDCGPCESDDLPCSSAPVWTSHMPLFWWSGC